MRLVLRLFITASALLVAACSSAPAPLAAGGPSKTFVAAVPAPVVPLSSTYRLQPGDVLLISVWKEQDLQSEVLIRPDGGVSFPLAGDVAAAGTTVDELRGVLLERIRHFIPEATVTVSLKATNGNKIYVVGKVARPGEFPLNRPIDVMQALSLAGGGTPFANLDNIRVLRQAGEGKRALSFDYSQVAAGRHLEQNVQLRSGDTVVVP